MSSPGIDRSIREKLLRQMDEARFQTDRLFQLVHPSALFERPIPERHRLAFYIGHLEAFDWNLMGPHASEREAVHPEYDRLFAFGIDPVDGALPRDQPADWPPLNEIQEYSGRVRSKVDELVRNVSFDDSRLPLWNDGFIWHVALEHRLMHAETLAYLLNQLASKHKSASAISSRLPEHRPRQPHMVEIPDGVAHLGKPRLNGSGFGWDNEFEEVAVKAPAFRIDAFNVTNEDFLEFIRSGAYEDHAFWSEGGWQWKEKSGMKHPAFWVQRRDEWRYQTMFGEIPFPKRWPVYVSHAEASAYARWKGKSLPTEAQWHRAALGTRTEAERAYPWGTEAPAPRFGNFDFHRWNPVNVGSFPQGASAFGVEDLVGNGWEWTSTLFAAFPGFEAFSFYPGYSANFFDGKHYVMKGGSSRTAAALLRRSFRNWFQPHYPYVYATFRCVEN